MGLRTAQTKDQTTPQQLDFGGDFRLPERAGAAFAGPSEGQRQTGKSAYSKVSDSKSSNSKAAANSLSVNQPTVTARELAASGLGYAEDHWLAVNRLTKALRKRSKGRGANPSRRGMRNNTGQKNLWLPIEANDGARDLVSAQVQSGKVRYQINSKAVSSVGREAGLQVCRHLVAALRLQHEQELAVQNLAAQDLAVQDLAV